MRKDVKCTFGILKKRWRILNNGLEYRDMRVCEKIFVACCWLHNFLLEENEIGYHKVGRGTPIGNDGVFLDGHTELPATTSETGLSVQFRKRRKLLATHLKVCRNMDNTDPLDLW